MCTSPDRSVEVAESLRVASQDALRIGAFTGADLLRSKRLFFVLDMESKKVGKQLIEKKW
jgi:hypothetical protein